jgi:hypothetical protein
MLDKKIPLIFAITTNTPMPPAHKVNDRIKVRAVHFDEGSADANGDFFSVRHTFAGGREHCHGYVKHVHVRRGQGAQQCRILYDDGPPQLKNVEAHLEPHQDEGDGPAESSSDESDNSNAGAAPGDDATPEGADAAKTDSDNDVDPHDLDGQDVQAKAMGATSETGGTTWKRVEKISDECATWQDKDPQQMKFR